MTNILELLKQPVGHVNMAQVGPVAWAKLHTWAKDFHQEVGDNCSCGQTAEAAMRGFHDAVSVHLGMEPQYLRDLLALHRFVEAAVEKTKPHKMSLAQILADSLPIHSHPLPLHSNSTPMASDAPSYDVVEMPETEQDKRRKEAVRKLFEAALAEG